MPKINYKFKPVNMKSREQAFTNFVYSSVSTYEAYKLHNKNKEPIFLKIKSGIFILDKSKEYADDELGFNKY